jgi:hypothetical protein
VDGTEQDEGLVVVVKERKETGKRGVLREDELGRAVIPLADLELMQARDNWSVLLFRNEKMRSLTGWNSKHASHRYYLSLLGLRYPLVTKAKGASAAVRLVITYTFSRVPSTHPIRAVVALVC